MLSEPKVMLRKASDQKNPLSQKFLILGITVFVCVAALAILDRLDVVDEQTLGWWLAERQVHNGGLNGRPQKLEDARHLSLSLLYGVLISGVFFVFQTGLLQLLGPFRIVNTAQVNMDRR